MDIKPVNMKKKICVICGDNAIGFNFKVVSCNSCKTFFRRHAFEIDIPSCTNDNNCVIDMLTRKNCIPCRLKKCLAVGMDKKIIFCRYDKKFKREEKGNEEKLQIIQIYKNSIDLKNHELHHLMTVRNASSIFEEDNILTVIGEAKNMIEMANLQQNSVLNVIKFCKCFEAFKSLHQSDQLIMLKNFFPERGFVRVAFRYDSAKDGFPVTIDQSDGKALFFSMNLYKNVKQSNVYPIMRNMYRSLNLQLENDWIIRDLITALLLFKERPNIYNVEHIRYHYILYNYLLRRYLEYKYADIERAEKKYHTLMDTVKLIDHGTALMKQFLLNTQNQENVNQYGQLVREIYDF